MKLKQKQDFFENCKLLTNRKQIGVVGQRLLLKIIELATHEEFKDDSMLNNTIGTSKVQVGDLDRRIITIPLEEIMKDSECLSTMQVAITTMQREIVEYRTINGAWVSFPFFSKVIFYDGQITLRIEPELWAMVC